MINVLISLKAASRNYFFQTRNLGPESFFNLTKSRQYFLTFFIKLGSENSPLVSTLSVRKSLSDNLLSHVKIYRITLRKILLGAMPSFVRHGTKYVISDFCVHVFADLSNSLIERRKCRYNSWVFGHVSENYARKIRASAAKNMLQSRVGCFQR